MSNPLAHRLSRRERQIMDAVYSLGQASAAQVLAALPEGQHYLYSPTHPRQSAAKSAMRQVLTTFFGGDLETAVATLLSESETELTDAEAARLSAMIEGAKGGPAARDTEGGQQ